MAVGGWLLGVHHKPFEYNSPSAAPSGWSGGTLDKPWTCPGTIEPLPTPVFDQPHLSNWPLLRLSAGKRPWALAVGCTCGVTGRGTTAWLRPLAVGALLAGPLAVCAGRLALGSTGPPSRSPMASAAWCLCCADWFLAASLLRNGPRLVGERSGWPCLSQKSR